MAIKFFSRLYKHHLIKVNKESIINSLISFKNIHIGEECYVFGDGSSLKYFDLSQFRDKISIASNNLVFHKDFKKLNIKYYCIYEPYWFTPFFLSGFSKDQPFKLRINKIQKFQAKFFNENKHIKVFTDISNYFGLKGDNIVYLEKEIFKEIVNDDKICQIGEPFNGSLRVQILLAILMGFKKIYLVGHDYTHKNSFSSHFYDDDKNRKRFKQNQIWNKDFFNIIKKYIEVISITIEGESNSFNSITYEKFTNKKLKKQSNKIIVSKKGLGILSSWPYYKI